MGLRINNVKNKEWDIIVSPSLHNAFRFIKKHTMNNNSVTESIGDNLSSTFSSGGGIVLGGVDNTNEQEKERATISIASTSTTSRSIDINEILFLYVKIITTTTTMF